MRRVLLAVTMLALGALPRAAVAQFGGGFGGRGGRMGGGGDMGRGGGLPAPRLPGPELDGPPDSASAQSLLTLSDKQASQYAQTYDSFMVATMPQRDSARRAMDTMHDRLDGGDRAAAMFYAERLQDLGKNLKDRQDKWEDNLKHFLTGDQMKTYRRWKDDQERAAESKAREEALRWRGAGFGGGFGGGERMAGGAEPRTVVPSPAGVAKPDVGSQAVRVGRTVYVTTQLAVDTAGALVGAGDLRTQAERAFANLATVLRAANAWPQDVVALTIYVVDYKPAQLSTIRDAGAAYFGANPPVVTVVGVQTLAREGALIGVAATATTASGGFARAPARDRER